VEVHNGYKFESEQKLGSFIFTIFINYLKNYLRDEKTKAKKKR
jgi:DNA-directed RNA polymerase specialized sigma24 family protein